MTVKVARIRGFRTSLTASRVTSSEAGPVLRQAEMAHDVLDVHDGVIDEDADGEDEGEKGDAVEGEPEEIEDEEGQGEGHGDGDRHDPRISPAPAEDDYQMTTVTETTAIAMWRRSSFDFSAAVSP